MGRTLQLALGDTVLDLDDGANGIYVREWDLGYPQVRDDTNPFPDRDGEWDNTAFFGPRVVSMDGIILDGTAIGSRQRVLDVLGPFLVASARPRLIFQIDEDTAPRYLTLRPSAMSGPVTNPVGTRFHVAWSAPDPAAYSTVVHSTTVVPTTGAHGRRYTEPQGEEGVVTDTSGWRPNRRYPEMAGTVLANAPNAGSLNSPPIIRIYGLCTNPAIINDTVDATFAVGTPARPFELRAGEVLTIDAREHRVYLGADPTNSRYDYVDFARSRWWSIRPGDNVLRFVPETAGRTATAEITWSDAYL